MRSDGDGRLRGAERGRLGSNAPSGWCDALALEKRDCAAGLEGLGQAGV